MIDETLLFDSYASANDMFNDDPWTKIREITEYSFLHEEIKVVKQGDMLRPGKIRKGHWKKSLLVITATGYLHCFDYSSSIFSKCSTTKEDAKDCPIYDFLVKPETYYR